MKLINAPVFRGVAQDHLRSNFYGVEIELEGYEGDWEWAGSDGSQNWSLVDDPSLRNGIEMVSRKLTQPRLKIALNQAQDAIDYMGLTSESRCGIHVHVNMLNLNWGQMWSFIALYSFMEPEIFAKFAPERHDNHFCVPMYWNTKMCSDLGRDINMLRSFNVGDIPMTDPRKVKKRKKLHYVPGGTFTVSAATQAAQAMHTLEQAVQYTPPPMYGGGGNKRWYPLKQYMSSLGRYKYGALTLYRMPDLGTVEIRLLPGTTDMAKIKKWVALIARIKHMAYKYPEPLDLQKHYERHGPAHIWRELKMGPRPYTTSTNKDDAEECAYKIIGTKPADKSDFDWNI